MSRTITNMVNFLGREPAGVDMLGPDGPIAQLLPGYKPRPQQMDVARTVGHAIRNQKTALIEAGTGTGKSIGLLTPAIASGKRIVYATATKALQDQLRKKDLPLLEQVFPGLKWEILKGRRNYACQAKMAALPDVIPVDQVLAWSRVEDWHDSTRTGDLAELDFDLPGEVRRDITAQDNECPGKLCEFAGDCWYYSARERSMDSRVIVTNHALLVQHWLTGRLLPDYDILIVDEAHRLENTIRDALRQELRPKNARKAIAMAMALGRPELDGPILGVREYATTFYRDLRHLVAKKLGEDETVLTLEPAKLDKHVRAQAEGFLAAVDTLTREIAQYSHTEAEVEEWAGVRRGLAAMLEERANQVVWAELTERNEVALFAAPVCVGPWLRSKTSGVIPIYASATLATGTGEDAFRFTREQLGVESALELPVDSPFDYTRQALYYLPQIEPEEGWEKNPALYAAAIAPEIKKVLWATGGRAFVLFTSYAVLKATFRLVGETGLPTRCQGDGSVRELLDWFRATRGAVLFATGAFWEGVDVPGQELSCVILDKVPFSSPADPVASARARQLGRSAFWMDSIPRAIMTIKQGLGRLIRVETDRGLLVLCDPRLRTKPYGRNILEALPGKPLPGFNTLSPASLPHVGKFLRPDMRAA